jgi:hypothetical protein
MDDLARQLVEAGAFRWEAGMLTTSEHRLKWCDKRTGLWRCLDSSAASWWHYPADMLPDLTDPATAALLAVQAQERGACMAYDAAAPGWEWLVAGDGARQEGLCPTLGEAAARALLALAQPTTTKETP